MDTLSSFVDLPYLEQQFWVPFPTQLWLDIATFLLICICVIWPPDLFVRWGLTLESLHPRFIRDGHLLSYLDMKIAFNRFSFSILPTVFVLYAITSYGNHLVLLTSLAISFAYFMYSFEQLANCLTDFSRGARSTLSGFTNEELRSIDSLPYSIKRFFVARGSYSNLILLNDHFFINERRFGYSIERMTDLNFCVYDRSTDTFDEWLTVVAERNDHSNKYEFSISSLALRQLEDFVQVDTLRNVFSEQFMDRITKNPRHTMNDIESLDPCFGCNLNQPEVIIRKNCCDCSPCTPCRCRPAWCFQCIVRIFMAPQLNHFRFSAWLNMRGETRCPFCQATFCVEDVLLIAKAD